MSFVPHGQAHLTVLSMTHTKGNVDVIGQLNCTENTGGHGGWRTT